MAREDEEAAVDTFLLSISPDPAPAPATLETAGHRAPQSTMAVGPDAEASSARDNLPPEQLRMADCSLPAVQSPTMPNVPGVQDHGPEQDLESQRRARAERLAAEEQEALESEAQLVAGREASAAEETTAVDEAGGVEKQQPMSEAAEGKPELEMPDGLEGLRRRRPDSEVHPPDSVTDTPRSASENAQQEARSGEATPVGDEQQCRICFGGREEEAELGRLISPCLCAGSMRYVHVQCINQWRGTGVNAKTFLECPQCHHQYAIRRTLASGLATSKTILYLLTTVLFLLITFVCGHVLLRYLVAAAQVAAEADKAAESQKTGAKAKAKTGGMTRHGDVWENEDGSVIIAAPGLTLVYDVIVEAVDIFLGLAAAAYDMWPRDGRSFHTRASRLALAATIRLILGLSVLGSLSFLSLLASLSLFAPLQLVYTIFGTGVFRGPLENIRRRAPNVGGILVILAVAIGVVNSIVSVYDVVRAIARKLLTYVETQILEVNPEQARLAREAAARQPHWFDTWVAERRWRRIRGWYEVWVRLWVWMKEAWQAGMASLKASVEARVNAAERAREMEGEAANSQGIQTLLEAEKEASKVVTKARQYRVQKLKDARTEAAKEIAEYKAQKEADFKKFESEHTSHKSTSQSTIDESTKKQLAEVESSMQKNRGDALTKIVDRVLTVEPKLHPNLKKVEA
ncbi:hypothetical protein CspHIS471_0704060 [Cutaneotrichosporon sp. HIS471]|nr:hypothetical protein CspHIS471_0704060 [Cutaneotrichosporon sp. HIS471]